MSKLPCASNSKVLKVQNLALYSEVFSVQPQILYCLHRIKTNQTKYILYITLNNIAREWLAFTSQIRIYSDFIAVKFFDIFVIIIIKVS